MNPKIRKRVPMTTESFADEKVVQKARYSDKVTAPALPEAGRKSLPSAQTVSVLIAAYRADKWLIESVNSVLSQELPPGWNLEVLVGVDGCPETLAVAQTIEDRRFGVVSFPVNSGTYVTFNSLVPLSRGSILVRHDADDVMLPTRLHKMIRAFEDPEVGRVTTWVAEKNVYPEPLIESPSKGRKIRDGTWSYRRDVFENLLGGFLPWRCAADTEMDLRSRSLGVKSHIVCEYLYLRRSHPGQLTQTEETGYGSALRKDYAKRIDELIIEYAANKPKPVVPTRVEGVRLGGLFSDKITASMASIPGRREGLEKVVRSLLPQVDHLNVYLNETPSIPGIEYPHTPDFLRHPKITAIWSRDTPFGDRGDAGKFYWADEVQGYHVICDDDLLYPSDFVETLIAGVERYGRKAAVGFHGAVLTEPFTEYYRSRRVYHFQRSLDADAPVHVLGSGTLAYHTSALVLTREDFRTANMADIWFGLKAQREEVLLVCLAHKEGWLTDDSSTRTDSIYAHSIKKAQTQKNTADLQTKVVKESWPWTLPVDRKGGAVCKSDPSVLEVKGPTRTARISVESGDHTHKFICATGTYYEFDLLHAVRDLKIEGLYVDVGANTGNHTTFFRLECPSTRVVAIEPDSENLAHLYRTIRLNDLEESVDVRPVAIHPTLSRVSMVQGIPKNKGTMRIEGEGDIEAQTLDRCLEGLEPALIKIDVEGLPLEVLRSGRSIVERCLPVIVCEANDHEASSIDAFLGDLGYERNPKRYCATATWIWQAKTG
jgi:FkbM family methyltransferase